MAQFLKLYWTQSFTIAAILIVLVILLGRLAQKRGIGMPAPDPLVISHESLKIDASRYGGPVPLKNLRLEQSMEVNPDIETGWQPLVKTLGTGSRNYKSGWFLLRNGKHALVFLVDRGKVVCIPTSTDYVLLLSVGNPDAFLAALRQAMTSGTEVSAA